MNSLQNSQYCQTPVPVAQLKYTKICIAIVYFVNLFMQGKKNFTPQLFVSVNLLDLVPVENIYRKFLIELDLHLSHFILHRSLASLTYNLKKYLRFTIKKPSILAQVIALRQGKYFAFVKSEFTALKNSIVSYSNFRIIKHN